MNEIVKTVYKMDKKKKSKLVAIILITMLGTFLISLILCSKGLIIDSIKYDYKNSSVGISQYVIDSKSNSKFDMNSIKINNNDAKELRVLYAGGYIENKDLGINFYGTDIGKYFEVFTTSKIKQGSTEDLKSAASDDIPIAIGQALSKKNNLKINDEIEVSFNNTPKIFAIKAIISNGIVGKSRDTCLISIDNLKGLLGIALDKGDVNQLLIYSNNNKIINKEDIELNNPDLYVHDSIDKNVINSYNNILNLVCCMLSIFVILISFFILYTLQRINVSEKIKSLGIIRTLGSGNKKLFISYVAYNLIIVFFATILGFIISGFFNLLLGFGLDAKFNILNYLSNGFYSIAITLLMSLLSVGIPLWQLLKNADKDLISGNYKINSQNKTKLLSIIVLICTAIIVLLGSFLKLNLALCILFLICIIISIFFIVPVILNFFKKTVENFRFRGKSLIAFKNITSNIYIRKNVSSLTIVSLLLCIVCLISSSLSSSMVKFYGDYKCEARIQSQSEFNVNMTSLINNEAGGADNCFYYSACNLNLSNKQSVSCLAFADIKKYDNNFFNMRLNNVDKDKYNQFEKNYYAVITNTIAERYSYKIGDKIKLIYDDKENEYTIVAFSKTLLNMGDTIFISNFGIQSTNIASLKKIRYVMLKSKNYQKITNDLRKQFAISKFDCSVYKERMKTEQSNMQALSVMTDILIVLIALITLIGVINTYKMCYLSRQHEFAIMNSNGYTYKNIKKILFRETLFAGILGSILGILYSFSIFKIIARIMLLLQIDIQVAFGLSAILITVISIAVFSTFGLLFSLKKIKQCKENTVELLKE